MTEIEITTADVVDADLVAAIIADAFTETLVAEWLVGDVERIGPTLEANARIWVLHALHGPHDLSGPIW